jgi:predicted SnoaL-like aldol condensation-catalyzing enzyme
MLFNDCEPAKAIARYAGDDYIQHSPHVRDGKEGFITYFEPMASEHPCKRVEVKRAIAEGNYVVFHCHQVWPGGLEYAGIDIFRLDEAGKVVENWDVLQELPDQSKHNNGVF